MSVLEMLTITRRGSSEYLIELIEKFARSVDLDLNSNWNEFAHDNRVKSLRDKHEYFRACMFSAIDIY